MIFTCFVYNFTVLWCLTTKLSIALYLPYRVQLVPHPVLYFPDVIHSTIKQHAYIDFSKRMKRYFILLRCWWYPSIQTTINQLNTGFACCILEYITLVPGSQSLVWCLALPHDTWASQPHPCCISCIALISVL